MAMIKRVVSLSVQATTLRHLRCIDLLFRLGIAPQLFADGHLVKLASLPRSSSLHARHLVRLALPDALSVRTASFASRSLAHM